MAGVRHHDDPYRAIHRKAELSALSAWASSGSAKATTLGHLSEARIAIL
jgi:hypothetical protein